MRSEKTGSITLLPNQKLALEGQARSRILEEMAQGVLDKVQIHQAETERGSPEDWFQKGESFYYGHGVPQSFEEAVNCYITASKMNHLDAQCNFTYMLLTGQGIACDPERAFRLFWHVRQKSEDAGEAGSYSWVASVLNLAYCYDIGLGVEKDEDFANYLASARIKEALPCFHWPNFTRPGRPASFFTSFDLPYIPPPKLGVDIEGLYSPHKIKVIRYDSQRFKGLVLVVTNSDGPMKTGDLVELDFFSRWNCAITEEGGNPASGLIITEESDSGERDFKNLEAGVIGKIVNRRIKFQNWDDKKMIVDRLQRMGIGPFEID